MTARMREDGVVHVLGEIDLDSSAEFREAVLALAAPGAPLVLDLSEVPFIDSSGLSELLALRADGYQVRLCAASEQVMNLLRITSTDQLLLTEPTD